MYRTLVIFAGTLFFGPLTVSAANPPSSLDTVFIDGQPCNRPCQSYMAWSRKVTPVVGQPERVLARPVTGQAAARRVTGIREPASKPLADGRLIKRVAAASDTAEAKIKDSLPASNAAGVPAAPNAKVVDAPPTAAAATDSGTGTTLQQVTAATAVAERLTAAATVAIVIARPDIKSISDLAHRTIAFDERQSLSGNTRTAMVAAGAAGVQLAESQTRAIDRMIGGEVPAAVLTLAPQEAAKGFPDVTGFNIFRIPLSSEMPQAETADQHPANAAVSGSPQELATAATAIAERMTAAATVAILIARPDIKSVSDLAHRTIAFDERQSALRGNTRTAIVAAGAAGVQLSQSQTRAIDRMISGEVPAAVLTLVSQEAAKGFPDVAGFNIFRIPLSSEKPQAETTDQRPASAAVSGSHEKTTQQLVTAATALAERMTAAAALPQGAPLTSSSRIDPRIAILIARPDIKSVSDLAHRTIAFDERQSELRGNTRAAMVTAGAAGVQLSQSQARAIDRMIDGEVPAAVVTFVSQEAADAFPEISGFKIFRIPLTPETPQAKVADLQHAQAFAAELDRPATKLAAAKQTAAAVAGDGPRASSGNAARLMALASTLLAQGNITAARDVLGRAAETGSAQASFKLAETYDPLTLPKWGVYGTRGDPTKARELYAKAEAGGIEEAKARFEALASSAR